MKVQPQIILDFVTIDLKECFGCFNNQCILETLSHWELDQMVFYSTKKTYNSHNYKNQQHAYEINVRKY